MNQSQFILFDELAGKEGHLGIITLNRTQVLNALNHEMFLALDQKLTEWSTASHIKAVVIRAMEGRAFCAGGDIRHAHQLKMNNNPELVNFFRDEYRMNKLIYHFPKPYIALLNGITMGGGAGISLHGSHRLGTEKLSFAMPETGIGFYPDVGTTYILSRLSYKMGIYLGLTGTRINYADCLAIGIVQEIVSEESLEDIISLLAQAALPDNHSVTKILQPFSISVGESELLKHQNEIKTCFSKTSVEEILQALENFPTEWCQQTAALLKTKSPTSLKVTLMALQKASTLSFDACMDMEYRLTRHFVQGHDFFEGIRAVIIDKDQKPHWSPDILSEVTTQDVANYFAPLEKEPV